MTGPKLEFGGLPISWVPTVRPEDGTNMNPYKKQTPGTKKLPAGWTFAEGRRPLREDITFDEVVEIPLRDGVKVRLSACNLEIPLLIQRSRSTVMFSGPSRTSKSPQYWQ